MQNIPRTLPEHQSTHVTSNIAYLVQILQGWGAGKFFSGSGSGLFFQAAPAPNFFPKWLRLLVFFSSGSGSGSKEPKTPGSDRLQLRLLTIC